MMSDDSRLTWSFLFLNRPRNDRSCNIFFTVRILHAAGVLTQMATNSLKAQMASMHAYIDEMPPHTVNAALFAVLLVLAAAVALCMRCCCSRRSGSSSSTRQKLGGYSKVGS